MWNPTNMEQLRSIKITVEVDTNKDTYYKEFSSMEEAKEWLESVLEDL